MQFYAARKDIEEHIDVVNEKFFQKFRLLLVLLLLVLLANPIKLLHR